MDAILTRAGDRPATPAPQRGARGARPALGRLLLTMAQATAERLVLPQRDLPRDWFRFPLP